jgi:hypothetical protein
MNGLLSIYKSAYLAPFYRQGLLAGFYETRTSGDPVFFGKHFLA